MSLVDHWRDFTERVITTPPGSSSHLFTPQRAKTFFFSLMGTFWKNSLRTCSRYPKSKEKFFILVFLWDQTSLLLQRLSGESLGGGGDLLGWGVAVVWSCSTALSWEPNMISGGFNLPHSYIFMDRIRERDGLENGSIVSLRMQMMKCCCRWGWAFTPGQFAVCDFCFSPSSCEVISFQWLPVHFGTCCFFRSTEIKRLEIYILHFTFYLVSSHNPKRNLSSKHNNREK